jgi:hypothetical protein
MVRFCLKIDILADMKNNIYLLFLNENGLNIVEKIIPLKVPIVPQLGTGMGFKYREEQFELMYSFFYDYSNRS